MRIEVWLKYICRGVKIININMYTAFLVLIKAECILRHQMNDDLPSFEPLNILFLMQWQIINFYESAEPLTDSLWAVFGLNGQ